MRAAGYSYGEIAKELGVTRGYAYILVNGKKRNPSQRESGAPKWESYEVYLPGV
jgi:transposase